MSLILDTRVGNSTSQRTILPSFKIPYPELPLSKAVDAKIVGLTEDIILALRGTFEDLIGSLPVHKKNQSQNGQLDQIDQRNFTMAYPLEAAIAQINTTLDIVTMLLRIERICQTRNRIKDVLAPKNEEEDEE